MQGLKVEFTENGAGQCEIFFRRPPFIVAGALGAKVVFWFEACHAVGGAKQALAIFFFVGEALAQVGHALLLHTGKAFGLAQ